MASAPEALLGTLEPIGGGDPIPLLKERLMIGRRETCDICLRFANVSTQHCELILEQGYWKIRDLQSKNGVKVNGERVIEKRVYPGDELRIAKHRFRLDYTPTTARSADAEVDELHEDIMRFSLLERAGLTKRSDAPKVPPKKDRRNKQQQEEEAAMAHLGAPVAQPAPGRGDDDFVDIAKPASKSSTSLADEDAVESVTPSTSAHDLSDDEFLKIVADDQKKPKDKK